ncbi:MAG TPA: hypothetical protein VKA43_05310, partial [Gammaproteobacteria bacterium]|nr:hypothetical protein [Gammaproteobacteria bacterium]
MRPLHAEQPSRAALLSVCGHGVLLALLMLVGTGDRPISNEGSFINAVIVPNAAEVPTASLSDAAIAPETETTRAPAPAVPQTPPPRTSEQRVVSAAAPTVEPDEPAPPSAPTEPAPATVVEVVADSTEPAQGAEEALAHAEAADTALAAAPPSGARRTVGPTEQDA